MLIVPHICLYLTQCTDVLLSCHKLKETDLPIAIEQGLSGCSSLKTLTVYSSYDPNVTTSVLRGVIRNDNIEELDISYCNFGKLSLYHLFIVM